MIADEAEHILDTLGVDYKIYKDRVALSCPIHDSSRPESLTLYTSGKKYVGNFVCWTNHCENDTGRGAINLIQQILSAQQKKKVNLWEVVEWVKNVLKCDIPEISIQYKEKKSFSRFVDTLNKPKTEMIGTITREYVRSSLVLPAEYYVKRGFSERVLDKFDVGFCNKTKTPMYMRVVVPVYKDNLMVGCVGRSINPECKICRKYHLKNKMCPTNKIEERWAEKWINSEGFTSGNYFYNLWNAIDAIKSAGSAILVEGQGDIWRLDEAGIFNGLGMFGCNLTDEQITILEGLPISDLYLALDSDEAGIQGKEAIVKRLSRYYNIHSIDLQNKDIGDTPIEEVKQIFRGIV